MRKYFISLMATALLLAGPVFADGYIASYTLNVKDAMSFYKEMDNLMASDWGKSFPGHVEVTHHAFDGTNEGSHSVIMNYANEADMAAGTSAFYTAPFGEFLAKVSDYSEGVANGLFEELVTGGDLSPEKNTAFQVYVMKIEDPIKYTKLYTKLFKAEEKAGHIDGAYGLRALVAGDNSGYTHYGFIGSSNLQVALENRKDFFSSENFKTFNKQVAGNREVVSTQLDVIIRSYEKK